MFQKNLAQNEIIILTQQNDELSAQGVGTIKRLNMTRNDSETRNKTGAITDLQMKPYGSLSRSFAGRNAATLQWNQSDAQMSGFAEDDLGAIDDAWAVTPVDDIARGSMFRVGVPVVSDAEKSVRRQNCLPSGVAIIVEGGGVSANASEL